MPVNHILVENHRTSDPDDDIARVISSATVAMQELINGSISIMAKRY